MTKLHCLEERNSERRTRNRMQSLNQMYTKLRLKDEFLMTLMKLRLGFHINDVPRNSENLIGK